MADTKELIGYIRFRLEQLSAQNAHHDFELLCFHLARIKIDPFFLPATGPVSSAGDQGRDFESFRTNLPANLNTDEFIGIFRREQKFGVGACSLQTDYVAKVKEDVAKIMGSGTLVMIIYFFTIQDIPVGKRHELQDWVKKTHKVDLEIFDGQAISTFLADPDAFWIAQQYLAIPSEMFLEPRNKDERFRNYTNWSKDKEIIFPPAYIPDEERTRYASEIRKLLRENKKILIKICGYSGMGKTRFVFETLNLKEFREFVFYVDIMNLTVADTMKLMAHIPPSGIIVFDNCSNEIFEDISRRWGDFPNISVFIISRFWEKLIDKSPEKTIQIEFFPKEISQEIISTVVPEIDPELKQKLTEISFGFPKFLIFLLNLNIQSRNVIVKSQCPEEYFKKLVTGVVNPELHLWNNYKRVLMPIALFMRIGIQGLAKDEEISLSTRIGIPLDNPQGEHDYLLSEEGRWLCNQIAISWEDFQGIIMELCSKGILDIDNYVSIKFFPMEHYLVNEWWRLNGEKALALLGTLPPQFRLGFQMTFFTTTEVFADMTDEKIYSNIVRTLTSILSKDSLSFVSHFIFYNWESLKKEDRNSLIRHIATTPDFQQLFFRDLLICIGNQMPFEEKQRIISALLNEETCLIQASQSILALYHFDPPNPIFDYILDVMLKRELTGQSARNFIGIIFKNIDRVSAAFIERLKYYATMNDLTKVITSFLIFNVKKVPPPLLCDLFKILMCKPDSYEGLTFLLMYDIELIPSTLYESFISFLLKFEELSLFATRILLLNSNKLNPKFLEEIKNKISEYHSTIGRVCRKLLSETMSFPPITDEFPETDQIIKQMNISMNQFNVLLLKTCNEVENPFFNQLKMDYKPQTIKLLILTDFLGSNNGNNTIFFYNPFSKEKNPLFDGIISQLFPEYPFEATSKIKEHFLIEFKSSGYFIEQVFPLPLNVISAYLEDIWLKSEFLNRLNSLISKKTPIIIISESLFKEISPTLQERGFFLAQDTYIAYPNEKNSELFKNQFQTALKKAGIVII